jgi:hypothetical protein
MSSSIRPVTAYTPGRCRQQPNRSGVGPAIGHVVRTSPEGRDARAAARGTRSYSGPSAASPR